MAEPATPPTPEDIESRLIAARARAAERAGRPGVGRLPPKGVMLGFRVGVELVVSTLVGCGIGWGLDKGLDTAPWMMVVFLFLGGTAGIVSIRRMVRGLDETIGLGAAERRAEDDAKVH